jgi:cell wall-associated NlpC family hydrolase
MQTVKRRVQYSGLFFLATSLLLTGCGSIVADETAYLSRNNALQNTAQTSPASHKGKQIVQEARKYLGTPYRYGGNNPAGFDCSGLVEYSHKKQGISVPRSTHTQLKQARRVSKNKLQPGDLVFFRLQGKKVSHVGIYAGNNEFIHSPSTGKKVSYARLDNPYWEKHLIAGGRFY